MLSNLRNWKGSHFILKEYTSGGLVFEIVDIPEPGLKIKLFVRSKIQAEKSGNIPYTLVPFQPATDSRFIIKFISSLVSDLISFLIAVGSPAEVIMKGCGVICPLCQESQFSPGLQDHSDRKFWISDTRNRHLLA